MPSTVIKPTALAAAVVLGAGLLAACGSESGGASGGARVVQGVDTGDVTGDAFEVVVPSGEFTVTVGDPVDEVPADAAADGKAHPAPEGREYVGIAWSPSGTAPAFGAVLHGTDPLPATIGVRTGGRELEVSELAMDPADGPANGVAWVPVDDGEAQLHVAYDGLTQTFDLDSGERTPGPADGFYDLAAAPADCPAVGPGRDVRGMQYTITCQISPITAVPYLAGEGWAEDGRTWLVFDLTLTPSPFRWSPTGDLGQPYASYRVDAQSGSAVSGDGEAVVLAETDLAADVYTATYAVPADAGGPAAIDLVRTYELTRQKGDVDGAPDTETVTYRATVSTGA